MSVRVAGQTAIDPERLLASSALRPLQPFPANATVLESGRMIEGVYGRLGRIPAVQTAAPERQDFDVKLPLRNRDRERLKWDGAVEGKFCRDRMPHPIRDEQKFVSSRQRNKFSVSVITAEALDWCLSPITPRAALPRPKRTQP
jgi:hypothetical protein